MNALRIKVNKSFLKNNIRIATTFDQMPWTDQITDIAPDTCAQVSTMVSIENGAVKVEHAHFLLFKHKQELSLSRLPINFRFISALIILLLRCI